MKSSKYFLSAPSFDISERHMLRVSYDIVHDSRNDKRENTWYCILLAEI